MATCRVSWPNVISCGDGLNPNLSAGMSTVAAMISLLRAASALRTKLETLFSWPSAAAHHAPRTSVAPMTRAERGLGKDVMLHYVGRSVAGAIRARNRARRIFGGQNT